MHFQSLLSQQGVADPERYLLTAVRSADASGYTLYAVVKRAPGALRVADSTDAMRSQTLTPVDLAYYRPYREDAMGRPVDTVVDWAGIERRRIRTQKGQAILMNLAANSILNDKRSPEYWHAQKRWMAGEFRQIAQLRQASLRRRMGLS